VGDLEIWTMTFYHLTPRFDPQEKEEWDDDDEWGKDDDEGWDDDDEWVEE
jgi:hypothetical protein